MKKEKNTFDENLCTAFKTPLEERTEEIDEDMSDIDFVLNDRFKRKMNRVFREQFGAKDDIPHPEVDNVYERIRSRIVRFFSFFMKG